MSSRSTISATYRLQFNKNFTFQDAIGLLDYLRDLGISHVYASPILRSRHGSAHGYDVIDPTRLNPELGDDSDFENLHQELKKRGMGLILDIVPNHMSASSENSWWMDVLENGPESAYASYFDIDWRPPSRNLENKLLLPVLGRPFAEVLENQEFKLVYSDGRFFVKYFESLYPLAPKTYRRLLNYRFEQLKEVVPEASTAYREFSGILAALALLSGGENGSRAAQVGERRLQFESIKDRLRQLTATNPAVQAFLADNLREFEGKTGSLQSFSSLERLLADQYYALAYWQNVDEEINYRRFFTISDLVGLRMQDPLVFDATHALILKLVERGIVNGLRIDHIDGLRDPVGYLNRLKEQLAIVLHNESADIIPIFVEKILARTESLRIDWPVAGTTGYEFLNALNAVFVDPKGAVEVETVYFDFIGSSPEYADVLYRKKKLVMSTILGVEMRSLGQHLASLAANDRYARDIPRADLTQALIEITVFLSVYRTYIRNLEIAPEDAAIIECAVKRAKERRPEWNHAAIDFVKDILLIVNSPHVLPDQREARLSFVMRWQQFTGPIMAKAFEDTFLYIYNSLISLNEVGGDPRPSLAPQRDFSFFIHERQRHWPDSLNATTTHDTKRAEDMRARINVLSEIPEEWRSRLSHWAELNNCHRTLLQSQPVPDRNEEIFIYQTLLGTWPLDDANLGAPLLERLQAYAIKATREAMVHTQWTRPNVEHEEALSNFASSILNPAADNLFLQDFLAFQDRIAFCGMLNGLSQTLLKLISPGIPDIYQGSELWDLRLVDPDNRRTVDFNRRKSMLTEIKHLSASDSRRYRPEIIRQWRDGRIKLYLIWKALNFRREYSRLVSESTFENLRTVGTQEDCVAGFSRRNGRQTALIVVPRWVARIGMSADFAKHECFWVNTQLELNESSPAIWENVLTGDVVSSKEREGRYFLDVADLLTHFPVALMVGRQ